MENIKEYINKRDNKKYYMFSVYLGTDIYTGKQKRTTRRGFKTKKEAEKELIKLKLFHTEDNSTNAFFNDILLKWFENYIKTLKEGTKRNKYFYLGQILKTFEVIKLNKISTNILQEYIDSLDKNVTNICKILKQFFDYAFNNGLIRINYYKNVVIPKKIALKNNKDNYLNKDELVQFFEYIDNDRDLVLFRLLAFTGARISEILALKWDDIDFINKTVNIYKTLARDRFNNIIVNNTKNNKNRLISIDSKTLILLKEYKQNKNNDYIFTDEKNHFLCYTNVTAKLKRICKKYGLKRITCHTFRHTHATLLFLNGVNVKDIQNRLGHANINTTLSIYTYILEDKQVINNFSDYVGI